MFWKGWVIFKQGRSNEMSARLTKTKPHIQTDEVAIHVVFQLPDVLFERPQLNATITIPESQLPTLSFDAEITNNIQEAIRQSTNLDININVVEDETDIEEKGQAKSGRRVRKT